MTNSVIVYKLGGTSQCIEGYKNLLKVIKEQKTNNKIIIVLSAISGVTDLLIKFIETKNIENINLAIIKSNELFNKILLDNYKIPTKFNDISFIKEIYDKLEFEAIEYIKSSDLNDIFSQSKIIGFGEIISSNLLNLFLTKHDLNPILLNSYDYIFSKKEIFQNNYQAEFYAIPINFVDYQNSNIFILQGYIGSTPSLKSILLGRGGSDTTGALVAKANKALKYEVWTDVDGIYTCDPKIFDCATIVSKIDYGICQELSAMGAKIMHPLSIKPCADSSIPIYIRNTFTLNIGTCICDNLEQEEIFYAIQSNQTLFKIKSINMWNSYGFVSNIFRKFSEKSINIDIVSTSQFSITTTTTETNKYKLMEICNELKEIYEVEIIFDCVILSVVKKDIKNILNKFNYNNILSEMIHVSDNNMTLNIVLKKFNIEIFNSLIIK